MQAEPTPPSPRAVTHLLYLHGFRSSPRSFKAQRLAREVAERQARGQTIEWRCPQLPPSPADTVDALKAITRGWPLERMAVIGSSLGGFYAHVMAERLNCRAVVLNPAVDPARDLAPYVGEQTLWHDPQLSFTMRPEYADEFRALRPPSVTRPARYFKLIAKGDELLDWREMAACYDGCQGLVVDGGDHALSDFDRYLPDILGFLDWTPA